MATYRIKRFTTVATLANLNGITQYQVEKELQYRQQQQQRQLVPTGKQITTPQPVRSMTPFQPQGTSYQKELMNQQKKAEQLTNKEEKQINNFNKNDNQRYS